MTRKKGLTLAFALVLAGGLATSTTAFASGEGGPGTPPPSPVVTCVDTTTLTASPASPQTVAEGKSLNVIFSATSKKVKTTKTGDKVEEEISTSTSKYRFKVVTADGLRAFPEIDNRTSAAFTLPAGTYVVTAKHYVSQDCTAKDGSLTYVITVAKPTPTPTVTVTTPAPTKTVVVEKPVAAKTPAFTG